MTLPRVVELVRVSSDGQHDRGTPDAQRHALDRLREQRPGRIVARIDPPHGVSGALPVDQRPDILELRRLVEAHGLDELRVYDLDRLSRAESALDRLAVLAICADAGAVIVDAANRVLDPSTDAGELTYYLSTLFARQERRRLLERTKAGRQRRAREGRLAGGTLPYAYRWTGVAVVVDDEPGAVVRHVYAAVAGGVSCSQVAAELNAERVPAAKGGRWFGRSVIALVRHKGYLGAVEQHQGGETYTLAVPALVDEVTWRAANAAIDGRRAWAGRPISRGTGLVQGLVRCGICGQGVHLSRGGPRDVIPRYACRSSHQSSKYGPPCGLGYTRHDVVDAAVWAEIVDLVTDPNVLGTAHAPSSAPRTSTWLDQIERCDRELARIDGLEADWLRLSRRGLLGIDALERQLAGVAADRATLRRTATVARVALAADEDAARLTADVSAALPALAERVRDAPREERRAIVEALVPKLPGYGVTLYRGGSVEIVGAIPVPPAEVSARSWSPADFGEPETARVLPFRRVRTG